MFGTMTVVEMRRFVTTAAAPLTLQSPRRPWNPCLFPFPSRLSYQSPVKVSRRFVVRAVVKRSPKRLKYFSPRFTKKDGLLYVEVDPSGSDTWKLDPIVELLKEGAVGVIPTDTVYAIVCDLRNNAAIERLRRIKDIEPSKASCNNVLIPNLYKFLDLRSCLIIHLVYCVALSKTSMHTPWDFLVAMAKVLRSFFELLSIAFLVRYASRKNVGVRMPDDSVCQAILEKMEAPLISTRMDLIQEAQWIFQLVNLTSLNITCPQL